MATSKDYLAFILDQLILLDGITHRSMMGEYVIYHHGRIAAYLCDDRLLVKILPSTVRMLPAPGKNRRTRVRRICSWWKMWMIGNF